MKPLEPKRCCEMKQLCEQNKKHLERLIKNIKTQRKSFQIQNTQDLTDHLESMWQNAKNIFPNDMHLEIEAYIKQRLGGKK